MSSNPARPEHLFIVRIWQEPEQTKAGEWRGSVEHIPSKQRMYFVSLNDLNDFIRLRLTSAPNDAHGQSETERLT